MEEREGTREGGNEGGREEGTEGRREEKEGKKGRKEGGMEEGRKEGTGRKEGRKEGRKKTRNRHVPILLSTGVTSSRQTTVSKLAWHTCSHHVNCTFLNTMKLTQKVCDFHVTSHD